METDVQWNIIRCSRCHYILALCLGDKIMLCRGGKDAYTKHASKHLTMNVIEPFNWAK